LPEEAQTNQEGRSMTQTLEGSNAELVADQIAKGIVPNFVLALGRVTGKDLTHLEDEMVEMLRVSFTWSLKGVENMTLNRAAAMLESLGTEAGKDHAARVLGLSNDLSGFEEWLKDMEKA
jgi:hypothetical protein